MELPYTILQPRGLLQKAILKESLGMNTNACGHRKLQDAKLTSAPDANYKTG